MIPVVNSALTRFANALNTGRIDARPGISYEINGRHFGDADVNDWELRASRRALANIKHLLYEQKMLNLTSAQCDARDRYFKDILEESNGGWRECRTDMHISDVKLEEVMAGRKWLMAKTREERALTALLPAHPEHYAVPFYEGEESIVETVGDHMARLRLNTVEEVPTFVHAFGDNEFDARKPTACKLQDGTPIFYVLHESRNTAAGCHLRLRFIFPEKVPQAMIDQHAEHLAIEFRFGIRTTLQYLGGTA